MQLEQDDLLHEELPPYLANLGLLSDPFANAPSGHFFYIGPDGEQRLDLMHHLAPYSALLVIVGEPGVGKTTLLQQFVSRAKETWRTAVITAGANMDRDDMMAEMSAAFGLSLQSQIDPQAQYPALIAQLRALRQTGQIPILLIDDAQYLSPALLELILKLCSENDAGHMLSIILLATAQLQTALAGPTLKDLAARVTHTFEVTPFTEEETARYIRHRLRAAGGADDGPFDSIAINKIHAAARGVPARINELAQQALMERTMADKGLKVGAGLPGTASATKRRGWMAVAGVIVVALLLAGPLRSILFKPEPLPPAEPQRVPAPMPSTGQEQRIMRPAAPETTAAPVASPKLDTATPSSEEIKPLPLPPLAATQEPTVNVPAPAPGKPPVEVTPAAPRAPQSADTMSATSRPAAKTPVAPPVSKSIRDEQWVSAQPDNHYTLQLMAVKDENTVLQFIATHRLQDKTAYFPIKRKGQTLYALVYGDYPNLEEATRAAKGLPAAWGTPDPWARSFKSLRGEFGR